MSHRAISCRGLTKSFGTAPAVRDVQLQVESGTTLVIVGPSGCGKTTLLRLIAGLERPEGGSIVVGQRQVVGPDVCLPPERRRVGLVFQDYALFPHLSVRRNIAYGLAGLAGRAQRVEAMLELAGLTQLARRMPHQLSGGEQQRVALARALAPEPEVLLLDEPFSNLDAARRSTIRAEVQSILRRAGTTAILVTHDQEEALLLGDQVAVMHDGQIQQCGTPEAVFHRPATARVAKFLGIADLVPGRVSDGGVETALGTLPGRTDAAIGTPVEVLLRPDDLKLLPLAPAAEADARQLPAAKQPCRVVSRAFRGSHYLYRVETTSGLSLHVEAMHTRRYEVGDELRVVADPGHHLVVFPRGPLA